MIRLQYVVLIDGEPYGSDLISEISINYDINTHLPYGSLTLADSNGDRLAKMSFMIGSTVEIKVMSPNSGAFAFPVMVVSKLFHDTTATAQEFGGFYQIMIEHPWMLSLDYTPHAYAPAKVSKIVKDILEDDTRGVSYRGKTVNIAETDDTGKIPRYKTETSDYEFITESLLPMAIIKGQPAYFFLNTRGRFNFISIQELYKEQAEAVLTGIDLASSIKDLDKITNATLTKEVVLATDFSILIGGGTKIPLLRGLRPKVNLDTMTGKFLSGIKSPTAVLTTANGKNSGNKIPVLVSTILENKPTDEISSPNKLWDDQVSLAINSGRRLDSMFRLECVVGPDISTAITIGSVVQLILPEKIVNEETGERKVSKAHWLVGKWVVQQMDYTITGDGAVTKLQCIKSNFTMNENSTTIAFPDLCYAV